MSSYTKLIVETLGCSEERAAQVEEVMRQDIYHSTLDWQSREELQSAAREAETILNDAGLSRDFEAR